MTSQEFRNWARALPKRSVAALLRCVGSQRNRPSDPVHSIAVRMTGRAAGNEIELVHFFSYEASRKTPSWTQALRRLNAAAQRLASPLLEGLRTIPMRKGTENDFIAFTFRCDPSTGAISAVSSLMNPTAPGLARLLAATRASRTAPSGVQFVCRELASNGTATLHLFRQQSRSMPGMGDAVARFAQIGLSSVICRDTVRPDARESSVSELLFFTNETPFDWEAVAKVPQLKGQGRFLSKAEALTANFRVNWLGLSCDGVSVYFQ